MIILLLAAVSWALDDVVEHTGPVNVVVCDGSPYNMAMALRALRWWHRRCVFDEIGRVFRAECGPYPAPGEKFKAPPNTVFLTQHKVPLPWMAGGTNTYYGPDGPVSIIRFRRSHAYNYWPIGWSVRWRLLLHEMGHALAYDDDLDHHTGPGTIMATSLDAMGKDDTEANQCSR